MVTDLVSLQYADMARGNEVEIYVALVAGFTGAQLMKADNLGAMFVEARFDGRFFGLR